MYALVNGQEMKVCDSYTIEHYHVPSIVLMEHAALAFVEELEQSDYSMACIGLVCGSGNNGGDGLAVARLLHLRGYNVKVFFVGTGAHATAQTKQQLAMIRAYGIPMYDAGAVTELEKCTLLVDAILGIGLSREVEGIYAAVIKAINTVQAPVIAVDIPSGVDAGTGKVHGCAVRAVKTITFAMCKAGLVLYPGAEYAGNVVVKDIGIRTEGMTNGQSSLYSYETQEVLKMLPERKARSNKGTYGRVVLIAGSCGMAGAAYLAGVAAYRMGCGLVRIVTPEENRAILQSLLPEAVLTVYDSRQPDMELINEAIHWGNCVGIGPGIGLSQMSERLLWNTLNQTAVPVVIDGDGLSILARHLEWLDACQISLVLTPHLKEMSRLTGKDVIQIQENLVETAQEWVRAHPSCCVLKDARTVVTKEPGRAYINRTGNDGMAVAGSGDVLTGMLCALLAGGMDTQDAAIAAVHLHGCAGDAVCERIGARSMTARDLANGIAHVWNSNGI